MTLRKWPRLAGARAILFNNRGNILLVKPRRKVGWQLPGGSIEPQESPLTACKRELNEELGILVDGHSLTLVCVDYENIGALDNLSFVFTYRSLSPSETTRLRPLRREIARYTFVPMSRAQALLAPNRPLWAKRLKHSVLAIKHHRTVYLENGNPVK